MRNTLFNTLPEEMQLSRIRKVMAYELTALQRQTLADYYFHRMSIRRIAQQRGVHASTVQRTLRRAEDKLRKYLVY